MSVWVFVVIPFSPLGLFVLLVRLLVFAVLHPHHSTFFMSHPDNLDVLAAQTGPQDAAVYRQLLLNEKQTWKFSIVPGQFCQSLDETNDQDFDYLTQHFGVVGSWEDTVQKLHALNNASDDKTAYKILFLARHGQGFHNVAHDMYGDDAWNSHWSKLNGNGDIVWGPDPELTELGIQQARDNREQWKKEVANGCPVPTKFFVSPLRRSVDTLIYTWESISDTRTLHPLIMENLRETTGVHTCDKRSTRSEIAEKYEPRGFVIEPGFSEKDVLYRPDYRETVGEHAIRVNRAFQQIFTSTPDPVLSLTSHSGTIRAQLLVLGHRSFAVGTGGIIPVFVKAERI